MADNKEQGQKANIFSILKSYKGIISVLVFLGLLGNGLTLIVPKLISQGIDGYTNGSLVLKTLIINFSLVILGIFVFSYLQSIVQTFASEKVARDLRTKLADKISRQSYAYIEKASPGKLLSILTSDMDSIKLFVSQAVVSGVSSIVIIVGASILLLTIDRKLALLVLLIIPIIGSTFFFVLAKVRPLFMKARGVIDWLNKVINESILGAAIIRVLNIGNIEYQKFDEANTDARDIGLKILKLFAVLIPIITFVANLAVLVILVMGGRFVILGTLSLGNFAAFISYVTLLIFPILVIGFISNIIAQASVSYQRVFEVLSEPEIVQKGSVSKELEGKIEFRDVSVSYAEKEVLKNISFELKAGSKTAIIGPTAAGKTQILYLLIGLIQPEHGQVLYDNTTLKEYNPESLYNQIGFVFQDSIIFNMSIRENIAFSNTVTEELMQKAIYTAGLVDFVQSLPEGLETIVSERGNSLSGGQKQRIMLARALAINPKILLLDDFTARIDQKTEKMILENIEKEYPGCTLVSVTQKIASVEKYDKIIVLMEGEKIAEGTHEYLSQNSPEYVQIYNSQRSTNQYELQS